MTALGTTAAITAFCSARVDGPGGFHLFIDGNGKITAGNGTLAAPKPNAFSLAHIDDCPGSTASCRAACYVHGLRQHAPETYALYQHNSRTIRAILDSEHSRAWAEHLGYWIGGHCAGGFRWHVSGDVFSEEYAEWIVSVCATSAHVRHWIYSRSLHLLDILHRQSTLNRGNLVVNISADKDNWPDAFTAAAETGFRICYMTTAGEVPDDLSGSVGDVIFPDYSLRAAAPGGAAWFAGLEPSRKRMVCPVDYHGKSEARRCGPCNRCMT